ncbi:hypothetical protein EBR57_09785, partial [bacterium]|nr:hypothetical protein [bacterium]
MRRIIITKFLFLAIITFLPLLSVHAAGFDDISKKLTSEQFPQIEQAIIDLAGTGSAEGTRALEAL